jgi:hypothetical protein
MRDMLEYAIAFEYKLSILLSETLDPIDTNRIAISIDNIKRGPISILDPFSPKGKSGVPSKIIPGILSSTIS